MRVGTLIEMLSKFDPKRTITLMVPSYAEKIAVEVVEVVDGAYLPADGIVDRDTIVVIRGTP